LSQGKTDIWMPVYIGDYLADTMHLTTEQHGAYLLLLFHLWRRGTLPGDNLALAQITGLTADAWSNARAVLAEFFEIHDGFWHHRRVERERERIALRQEANTKKARMAALERWKKQSADETLPRFRESIENTIEETSGPIARGNAPSNTQAMPHRSESESESESEATIFLNAEISAPHPRRIRKKASSDPRHTPYREILQEYWSYKNPTAPEMPWQGRDARALSELLSAVPSLNEEQFRQLLRNRAKSAVAHGDRVYLWIGNLTRYQEEIGIYNKPAAAGGGNASRAEINRSSVMHAVDRALEIARRSGPAAGEHAGRVGQAGDEQTTLADGGMSFADGRGPVRCALAISGNGDRRMAQRNAEDGQARADGPLPYGPSTASAGGVVGVGGALAVKLAANLAERTSGA
jgi:uncharacterized protein YdaU (DUF1376 family)